MVYFPDLDEGQLPERKYIFRVLSAQRPIQLAKLVKQARDNRAIESSSQDDMIIEMTADVKETILSLLSKKSKLLCCSYITVSNMETALLFGSLLLQVRSIICDPTWSNKDPSWRPVSIFESVIVLFNQQR